jgi:predicted nuclease with TOPRIM domain
MFTGFRQRNSEERPACFEDFQCPYLILRKRAMNHDRDTFEELVESLKQQRDELRVQMHLAQLETREELEAEWKALEKKWEEIKPKLDAIRNETAASSKNIFSALALIAEEIEEGYKRVKKHLE